MIHALIFFVPFALFVAFIYAVLFGGRRIAGTAWRILASLLLAVTIPVGAIAVWLLIAYATTPETADQARARHLLAAAAAHPELCYRTAPGDDKPQALSIEQANSAVDGRCAPLKAPIRMPACASLSAIPQMPGFVQLSDGSWGRRGEWCWE